MKKFNVIREDWSGRTTVATTSWRKAWRLAARLNKEAREKFATGRTMYEVPEFKCEEVTP